MSEKEKIIILWFKRDLRISDHQPLVEALKMGNSQNIPVVAIYSFEPSIVFAPDFSDFHRQFIEDSLQCLLISLKKIGIPLLIFERNISDVMKIILQKYSIEYIFSHEETGNAISYKRDMLMAKYLRIKGITWKEFPSNGVVRRLKSRDDWSKIWQSRMLLSILPPPEGQQYFCSSIVSDNWQKNIGNPHIQKGGEIEGQYMLASFLVSRGQSYISSMSRPIDGQDASSRISPYLAYGCLSLKQVVNMTWARMHDLKEKGDIIFLKSLQAFHSRLHWHSHFIQKLESEPRFEYENAFMLYDSIRTEYDEIIMNAIENAKTGIPFIDAIIKQLQQTGWINFRARATLVSFVCCTCMQPWKGRFAHWLAKLFTDYEPGIHYLQFQMQAGTMGINTIRIYNPVKQLHDKDTDGKFITTWLPEIARLPKHLQAEPWKLSAMESIEYDFVLGRDYPLPIVDVEESNRYARGVLYALRDTINSDEKKSFLQKHGSRKENLQKKNIKQKNIPIPSDNLSLFD